MSDPEAPGPDAALQFDRAVSSQTSPASDRLSVTCDACHAPIADEYYEVNGHSVCASCRTVLESAAETPIGMGPLAIAAACGFFAAVAGAIIYYALMAFAHLEIGIVAVLIGYMVGYAVRKGARGGGLRFQILAVLLTYAAVALAYTPIVIGGAIKANQDRRAQAKETANSNSVTAVAASTTPPADGKVNGGKLAIAIVMLIGTVFLLPVLVIFASFPSGLISAFIIFIGLRQAWKMTGAPHVQILGPYRVGPAATTSA
jgi:hypothetical protein